MNIQMTLHVNLTQIYLFSVLDLLLKLNFFFFFFFFLSSLYIFYLIIFFLYPTCYILGLIVSLVIIICSLCQNGFQRLEHVIFVIDPLLLCHFNSLPLSN
jgi:hypothetical protein